MPEDSPNSLSRSTECDGRDGGTICSCHPTRAAYKENAKHSPSLSKAVVTGLPNLGLASALAILLCAGCVDTLGLETANSHQGLDEHTELAVFTTDEIHPRNCYFTETVWIEIENLSSEDLTVSGTVQSTDWFGDERTDERLDAVALDAHTREGPGGSIPPIVNMTLTASGGGSDPTSAVDIRSIQFQFSREVEDSHLGPENMDISLLDSVRVRVQSACTMGPGDADVLRVAPESGLEASPLAATEVPIDRSLVEPTGCENGEYVVTSLELSPERPVLVWLAFEGHLHDAPATVMTPPQGYNLMEADPYVRSRGTYLPQGLSADTVTALFTDRSPETAESIDNVAMSARSYCVTETMP